MWSSRRSPQDAAGLSKPGGARRHVPALSGRSGDHDVVHLLQSQQLTEQDGFVTALARAAQTEGLHKQPAFGAAALAEGTFAARRTLVHGVGDQRPTALEVSAELAQVHARQCLMAESKRTLFARVVAIKRTSAGWRSTTRWAAAVGAGGTVTRTVTSGQ